MRKHSTRLDRMLRQQNKQSKIIPTQWSVGMLSWGSSCNQQKLHSLFCFRLCGSNFALRLGSLKKACLDVRQCYLRYNVQDTPDLAISMGTQRPPYCIILHSSFQSSTLRDRYRIKSIPSLSDSSPSCHITSFTSTPS